MFEISLQEITRATHLQRIWFRLRCRFQSTQMTPNEIAQMRESTLAFWRDYNNNNLQGQPLQFRAIQGVIVLSSGSTLTMQGSVSWRNVEEYIRIGFAYLTQMSQGINVFTNPNRIRISGDMSPITPIDIMSGRIDFKIGFNMLYPPNAFPRVTHNENFEFEDQRPPSDDEPPSETEEDREREFREEQQRQRREELERRINILHNEIRDRDYNVNINDDILISLRTARNRWSRDVQNLRNQFENQNRILKAEINRLQRQMRGLNRLLLADTELSSTYDPDTEEYSSSDYSNLQSSPFSVPDEYLDAQPEDFADLLNYVEDSGSPTPEQLALYNMFNIPSPSLPSSTTELIDEEELEEIERQNRVNFLEDEISKLYYQLNQIDDLIRDLRSKKVRRNREFYTLLNEFETEKKTLNRIKNNFSRELRTLKKTIPRNPSPPLSEISFYPPSSVTDLYSSSDLEELEKLRRRDELIDLISKANYELNQLADIKKDLRNKKNKRNKTFDDLLRNIENSEREIHKQLTVWRRELRSLQRSIY